MPFVDLKITVPIEDSIKEEIKKDLGSAITALHKTERYLMVGIDDSYDLWLGGKKLEKGAYVSVSLYGNATPCDYNDMTGKICNILEDRLGIPGEYVYVTYRGVKDWGWNGQNF